METETISYHRVEAKEGIVFTLPKKELTAALIAFKAGLPYRPVLCKVYPPMGIAPYEVMVTFSNGYAVVRGSIALLRQKSANEFVYVFALNPQEISSLLNDV